MRPSDFANTQCPHPDVPRQEWHHSNPHGLGERWKDWLGYSWSGYCLKQEVNSRDMANALDQGQNSTSQH